MAIGEDQVRALAYHRKSAHLSLQQLSQGLDSAFISQTTMELPVTDSCVCTEALHHTGSKRKLAPEAGLSHAGTPAVPGHTQALGQPLGNGLTFSSFQHKILGQILVTYSWEGGGLAQIPCFNQDVFFPSILLPQNVFAALFSITPVKRLSFLVSASNSQVVTAILLCTLLKYSDLHDQ